MQIKTRKIAGQVYQINVETIKYHTQNYVEGDYDTFVSIITPENCFDYTDRLLVYKLNPLEKCSHAIDGYYLVNEWRITPNWVKKQLMKTLKVNGLLDDKKRKEVYLKSLNEYRQKRLKELDLVD